MDLPENIRKDFVALKESTGLSDKEMQALAIKYACCEQPIIAWRSGKPSLVSVKIPRVLLQKFKSLAVLYGSTQDLLETAIIEQMMLDAMRMWAQQMMDDPKILQALDGLAKITENLRRQIQDDQSTKEEDTT